MVNRLADERSPYLRQHATNPVDWYPYGTEAFRLARTRDKPVLISIGYSSCHWCHVMAHESFEDPGIASLMNEHFVNVKVDREERPDVDAIYMEAVQALTGQGGWPLNVFVTPDGRPFFGGTYFPPRPGHGLPSWSQILEGVAQAYSDQRDDVTRQASAVAEYIQRSQNLPAADDIPGPRVLEDAWGATISQFDWTNGGFGSAPKFPQPLGLEWVLREAGSHDDAVAMRFLRLSLDRMAAGGIFDQLGGGFHRYSVDAEWLVPHFEKMLYDNALLARLYLHAFQASGQDSYRAVTQSTLDYLLRDMRSPDGAFYASQDADSEGEEGRYYVWTPEEFDHILGPELGPIAKSYFGVTASSNFEGKTILTSATPTGAIGEAYGLDPGVVEDRLRRARELLLAARSHREPPGTDTKVLVSWNALAIATLAQAGAALGTPAYVEAARTAADFVLDHMRPGGNLVRSYNDGPGRIPAFLEDYAYLLEALIVLYEVTAEAAYLSEAERTAEVLVERFGDPAGSGFFDTEAGESELPARPRSFFDNPIPSGNSAAAFGLLRLEALTGERDYGAAAEGVFRAAGTLLPRAPLAFSHLLCALDFYVAGPTQVAVIGTPGDGEVEELTQVVHHSYLPNLVLAVGDSDYPTLLEGRSGVAGQATAFVCRNFACNLPVTSSADLARQLGAARPTRSRES
jgi:uncharacterized protein YyaL (SSP411 family)